AAVPHVSARPRDDLNHTTRSIRKSMPLLNRQWLLARRPGGHIVPEDFEYREQAMAMPELKPGELLVKSLLFRCTPAMRTWMKETSQIAPPMAIGKPVTGTFVAQSIVSANTAYPDVTTVSHFTDCNTDA